MTQLEVITKWLDDHPDVFVQLTSSSIGLRIDVIDRATGKTNRRAMSNREAKITTAPLTLLLDFMYEELMEA